MTGPVSDRAWGARRLGLGISGPHGTALVSRKGTESLVQRAYELGVRLFDTAPSYGAGEAEKRLGEALVRLPRFECIVSTKVGLYSSGAARRERDFSPDTVRRSIDDSMQRLKLRKIDWLFLHGPSSAELSDGLFKAIEEEQYSGRIGLLGIAGRGEELEAALDTGLFKLVMTPVHAALDTDQLIRLSKIRNSGAELIGIEAVAPALPRYSLPTSPGKIWRLARHAAGRAGDGPAVDHPPSEGIAWALTRGRAHRVVTTTTRMAHLEENVSAAISADDGA